MGIQRAKEVVGLVRGDAEEAVFDLTLDVVLGGSRGVDFRGPYLHGKAGERFIYLSWGAVAEDGRFEMFRRAKLHLAPLDEQAVQQALDKAEVMEARLDLTDQRGGPLCASVRPPTVRWQVAGTEQAD